MSDIDFEFGHSDSKSHRQDYGRFYDEITARDQDPFFNTAASPEVTSEYDPKDLDHQLLGYNIAVNDRAVSDIASSVTDDVTSSHFDDANSHLSHRDDDVNSDQGEDTNNNSMNVRDLFDWYLDSSDEGDDFDLSSVDPGVLRHVLHSALHSRQCKKGVYKKNHNKGNADHVRQNDCPMSSRYNSAKSSVVHSRCQSVTSLDCHDCNQRQQHMLCSCSPLHRHHHLHHNNPFSHNHNNQDTDKPRKAAAQYIGGISAGWRKNFQDDYGSQELQPQTDDVIKVLKGASLGADNDRSYLTPTEAKARLVAPNASMSSDERSSPIKYFTHELSLRGRLRKLLARNSTLRLANTFFDFVLKNLLCLVYIIRVSLDDVKDYECHGSPCIETGGNATSGMSRKELFSSDDINWYVLLWVHRSLPIWIVEVSLCFVSLTKAVMTIYISTKGHRSDQMISSTFFLEVVCALPMLSTLCYPPLLIDLFVPVYLNCWLARKALERIYNNLHLNTQRFQNISVSLAQQMTLLMMSIICLVFTNVCSIQHIQRASKETPLSMFDSFYFVIVTFSTVGYGDISPDIWLSRLFMVLMICVAFATIPRQIEGIISTWMERKRAGGEYSSRSAHLNKHVVVCSSSLTQDTVMDFLHEFYAHPRLEEHTVILLCPEELDGSKQVILKDPKWMHRVIYMMGSSLKDIDLQRCRVQQAEACFFLAPRPSMDKSKADRHTILRSWAVKDFAPQCRQYIQLFRAVNKIHVKFADHIVCEDEFKYALLANNCLYPGLSTLVSLLVHTSSGREGLLAQDPWQQVYGRHSGNEIYHIQLQKSVFFSQYEGESFARASADAHHRFGVALLAVLDSESSQPRLQLNPGPQYKLKGADFCFYMSVTREEYSKISPEALKSVPRRQNENLAQIALALQKYQNESEILGGDEGDESVFDTITSLMGNQITKATHNLNNSMNSQDGSKGGMDSSMSRISADKIFSRRGSSNSSPANKEKVSNNNIKKRGGKEDDDNSGDTVGFVRGSVRFKKSNDILEEEEKVSDLGGSKEVVKDVKRESRIPTIEEKERGIEVEDEGEDKNDEDWYEDKTRRNGKDKKLEDLDNVDHRHGAGRVLQFYNDMGQEKLTTGPPPVTIYSGAPRASCHVMTEPRQQCCLEWGTNCMHCNYKNAKDERWHHQLIILSAQYPTSGIFNFIVPLRSSFIGVNGLSPIVLLLEEEPDSLFVDTMAQFPLVYWMLGSISRVDDLLLAGINKASHLVVVNRASDRQTAGGEDILTDSETIVAVQTIFKLFPNTNVITELSQASNMRFMQFSAQTSCFQRTSLLEQRLKNNPNSNLNYIFRLPFAAGHVFSASMLDTLLYQTFVKGYLISFVRLLLGIDAEEGSGHLSSIRVKRATIQKFPEYGELYDGLCSATGEIPFAIYRTERMGLNQRETDQTKQDKDGNSSRLLKSRSTISHRFSVINKADNSDISGMIRNRLRSLDLAQHDYCAVRKRPNTLSYVITNPSPKRKLRVGDIVYVLQPSSMYAKPSKHKLYIHKAYSYSGNTDHKDPHSPAQESNTTSPRGMREEKVGRFNLRRFVSERPDQDSSSSMNFQFGGGEGSEEENRL